STPVNHEFTKAAPIGNSLMSPAGRFTTVTIDFDRTPANDLSLPVPQHRPAAHRRGLLSRFRRGEEGVTAIEFAIVALPFCTLMFAIIETAIVFFASQALETATADAARLVMTGQAQKQNMSQAAFKQAICDNMRGMIGCEGLKVDVRTYANFSGSATRPD